MPVTYEGYAISATVTAVNLASNLEEAFRDAGLIASGGTWYDSFLSGSVENRVLELVFDNSKTYGKTYHWFQFVGADIYWAISTGWNTTSHIPAGQGGAGTQYLDWLSTVTNTTANHLRITPGFNTNQGVSIARYTSQARTDFSVFLLTNGSSSIQFFIDKTAPDPSMVDLNKEIYTSMFWVRLRVNANTAEACFQLFPCRLRRSHLGRGLRSVTSTTEYGANNTATSPWEVFSGGEYMIRGRNYGFPGNAAGDPGNYSFNRPVDLLPVAFTNTNPGFTSDVKPIFYGQTFNCYSAASLPSDFGLGAIYDNNTLQVGEVIEAPAGVEEHYVIAVANSSAANAGKASVVFTARKV